MRKCFTAIKFCYQLDLLGFCFWDIWHYFSPVRLCFVFISVFIFPGAMQTPEAGADSTSTVPLQTTVPVQPTGSTQQVSVQQQVNPACLSEHLDFSLQDVTEIIKVQLWHFYLSRPRLFNRFSMFTQHRCSMWMKTVASTRMETCESICNPAPLLIPLHKY